MNRSIYNMILQLCVWQLRKATQRHPCIIIISTSGATSLTPPTYTYGATSFPTTPTPPNPNIIITIIATHTFKQKVAEVTENNSPTYAPHCSQAHKHHYGYRYYSSDLGRWPSRDPLGEEGGVNLQAFAGNQPVGLVDINGLLIWNPDPRNPGNDVPPCVSCGIRPFPPPWDTDPIPDVGSLDPLPTEPMVTTYGPESCSDCEKRVIDYRRAFEFRPPLGWICTERGCDYNPPGNSGVIGWDRWHLIQVIMRYICVDEDATGILFDFQQRVGGLGPSGNFRETLWIYLWQ